MYHVRNTNLVQPLRLDAQAFESRKDQRQALNRWNQHILGLEYKQKAARLCPATREWVLPSLAASTKVSLSRYIESVHILTHHSLACREKRRTRDVFDLHDSVHKSEYENVRRPIDPKTKLPIEPSHKFEVNLEADNFSEEKSEISCNIPWSVSKSSQICTVQTLPKVCTQGRNEIQAHFSEFSL